MRAPRFRFPDHVRSTTRTIASQMVRDETIARTPEELDAWISRAPDVKQSLEKGGYNTAFTAGDLLPLLQVFVVQAGGPPPPPDVSAADEPRSSARRSWLIPSLLVALAALLLALWVGVLG